MYHVTVNGLVDTTMYHVTLKGLVGREQNKFSDEERYARSRRTNKVTCKGFFVGAQLGNFERGAGIFIIGRIK